MAQVKQISNASGIDKGPGMMKEHKIAFCAMKPDIQPLCPRMSFIQFDKNQLNPLDSFERLNRLLQELA